MTMSLLLVLNHRLLLLLLLLIELEQVVDIGRVGLRLRLRWLWLTNSGERLEKSTSLIGQRRRGLRHLDRVARRCGRRPMVIVRMKRQVNERR